jgi:hypothetical protein
MKHLPYIVISGLLVGMIVALFWSMAPPSTPSVKASYLKSDLSTPPKVITVPRLTFVVLITSDGHLGAPIPAESVLKTDDGIALTTEFGVMVWKGGYLILDQDKMEAQRATEAAKHPPVIEVVPDAPAPKDDHSAQQPPAPEAPAQPQM